MHGTTAIGANVRRIFLDEKEPIKFFILNSPDKVEAIYQDKVAGVYFDEPGYLMAMVAEGPDGAKFVMVEKI